MKRNLFFLFEKLKITRAERHAVLFLTVLLTLLVALNAMIRPSSPFDKEYYRELDEQFRQQTALLEQKEQRLLARYSPQEVGVTAPGDTLPVEKEHTSETQPAAHEIININSADATTLQRLPGVGAAYAARILAYRREYGPFKNYEELLKIKGIGESRLQKIKPFLRVGSADSVTVAGRADAGLDATVASGNGSDERKVQAEAEGNGLINVNSADAKMLQALPGIGPAYAARIVAHRQQNGLFMAKDDLLKIKGIGKKRLAKIKPFIKLTEQ